MGLYIKGMEMPTGCGAWHLTVWPDGQVEIVTADGELKTSEAVSIPPHGRLIDADELIERIDGIWDCNDMVFKPNDHCCNVPEDCKGCKWYETKEAIKRIAVAASTIILAEEEK